ncbi:hypothetical protein [Bombella intestini]|uniref:hypothetical protein n=1 Tax=Bombella intestini TaxID=1539051 RepID=UPI00117876A1|nr:hypothetical protein [Bombella intestini]
MSEERSRHWASSNVRLSAEKGILFKGASLKAGGDATLMVGQNINLDALSTHGRGGVFRRYFIQTGRSEASYC